MKQKKLSTVFIVSVLFVSLMLSQAEADYKTKLTLTIAAATPTYDEAYILTVPADFTITQSGWNSLGNITATHDPSYSTTFTPAKKLVVTASSQNNFALVSDTSSISYTLKTAQSDTSATIVFEFSADDINASGGTNKAIGVDVEDYSSKPVGDYEDEITYTASVESVGQTASYSVGDKVTFGTYSNYELKWTVMEVTETQVLLLCDSAVAKMAWDSNNVSTWENSSLYSWLNGEFKSSFDGSDVRTAKISRVTLLSESEMSSLTFDNTTTTKTCKTLEGGGNVPWWLSTLSEDNNSAKCVSATMGSIQDKTVSESAGVRPALWLSLQ